MRFWLHFTLFLCLLTLGTPARANGESHTGTAASCKALSNVNFSMVRDAPTRVVETRSVAPTSDAPGYCEARGYVSPDEGFALRLPLDHWNGKFLELGCGGSCGSTVHVSRCEDPLRRGYACIVSDGGHRSNGSEMKWAYDNPQSAIEYFVRASHEAALAGKAIVAHFYGENPRKSYFMGCSAGGLQAMWEAQRFPWDFNGIVAGGPALRLSRTWVSWLWANRALVASDGVPRLGRPELEGLHQAVVAKCDMNDGVKDGLIGDPRDCEFDPAELKCGEAKTRNCLTEDQVKVARKIYEGPVDSQGRQIAPPIALRGSELSWLEFYGGDSNHPTPFFDYLKDWYYYAVFPIDLGSAWKPEYFDFDRDYKRLGAMQALEPNNPDLRPFKSAGGKLLAYTGWSDAIEGVLNTVDYYETAERVMGGRAATQDFFRLFVIPGMNHCGGGEGPFTVDYLTYLEAWVEDGKAPDKVIGSHGAGRGAPDARQTATPGGGAAEFSRPIFPYPIRTQYRGRGDSDRATNFIPAPPQSYDPRVGSVQATGCSPHPTAQRQRRR